MKPLNLITASLFALGIVSCGNAQDTPSTSDDATEMSTEMAEGKGMGSGDHAMDDGIGYATGVIRSVGSNGEFLTIEHGPFQGIEMGAMTMGFDIMGDVDLTGFKDGDEVAFMVKQGRDGSYRIMAICNIATDGADCLDGLSDR